jgi:hypothetical protein
VVRDCLKHVLYNSGVIVVSVVQGDEIGTHSENIQNGFKLGFSEQNLSATKAIFG